MGGPTPKTTTCHCRLFKGFLEKAGAGWVLRSNHQGCTNFTKCVFTFFWMFFWPVGRTSSNWMPHPPVRWPSTAPRRWSLCGCPTQEPPREALDVQLKWLRQDSPDPPMMTFGMACRSLRTKKTREKTRG
jgi:hypothetical protein